MTKLVVGCGYLGQRVADVWRNQGSEVAVVTRKPDRADRLRELGFLPIVGDVTGSLCFDRIPKITTVLFAVGFDRGSGDTIRNVYVNGLRNTLDQIAARRDRSTPRIIYISSTGVYGQSDDEWVDEDSPCNPTREGGRACLEAEKALAEHVIGANRIILRLAGIYGPNRVPKLDELRQNKPLAVETRSYLNLIHVDDAARIVVASENISTPRTLLVADGHPVLRGDFYEYAAKLIGVRVQFEKVSADASDRRRSVGGKRCRVGRLKREIEHELQFPSFRHGLERILGDSSA